MKLRLNGKDVDAAGSLLDVCRRDGVEVPTLCFDDRVERGGHCRACMVEVDGVLQPACTTPARPGANVQTGSERVRSYRRDLGELILAESAPRGRAAAMVRSWGADGTRYSGGSGNTAFAGDSDRSEPRSLDRSHPFLRIDMAACVLCRLCIDACADIQGQFVYAALGRGAGTRVGWGDVPFDRTECVSCGACASVCPSSAITDVDRIAAEAVPAVNVVRTTCSYCGVGCQLDVHVGEHDIAFVEGARSPVNDRHLCVKGRYAHSFARHRDRLVTPLVRRGGTFEPVGWGEAIALVAGELARLQGRVGALSSSRCTNEENYLLQKWMRAGFGTNNVDCCARVCHAPSAAGMRRAFGTGAATNSLADIECADLLFVCGSNTTQSHPIIGARVKQAVLSGKARLVVMDPRRTELAALADVHLQPRPGTNVPLLNALAAVIVQEHLFDCAFVTGRARGVAELFRFLADKTPERTESVTGVPAALVRQAARLYAQASAPMQMHGLGVTEHFQGSESVMLLCNLAVLVGAVGREGVGVNPLRGQNNVQGAADMGCQPDLLTGYAPVDSFEVRERFQQRWQRPVPVQPGLTLPRMYEAIDHGQLAGLFIMGEDVVQTDPDSDRVRERLSKLEFLVVQEIFFSETARLAHVVLPGASAFEKDGTFTNTERRVQRVRKALAPPGDARPDWQILRDLMIASGLDAPYSAPRDVFDEIRQLWPSVEPASYEALDEEGLQWPVLDDPPQGTRVLHRRRFANGEAVLHCVSSVASPAHATGKRPLTLMTGRVLEHYNSGSMTRRSDAIRLVGRDGLEMHPQDATERGIGDGDDVVVTSDFGELHARVHLTDRVRANSLFLSFHFPETATNRITSDVVDRLTDCPEYKVTAVQVRKP